MLKCSRSGFLNRSLTGNILEESLFSAFIYSLHCLLYDILPLVRNKRDTNKTTYAWTNLRIGQPTDATAHQLSCREITPSLFRSRRRVMRHKHMHCSHANYIQQVMSFLSFFLLNNRWRRYKCSSAIRFVACSATIGQLWQGVPHGLCAALFPAVGEDHCGYLNIHLSSLEVSRSCHCLTAVPRFSTVCVCRGSS